MNIKIINKLDMINSEGVKESVVLAVMVELLEDLNPGEAVERLCREIRRRVH